MSVQLSNISKIYGTQKALDSVSFEAKQGEVLGFLGPNGAGKTTTMKIVTCFIPPSAGVAKVCGFDVEKNPMEVRQRIGYLPEHNPLYKDMYVKEYLGFVAGLHKLSQANKRVSEVIEMTGLGLEQHKLISSLSKGYRQRVGLAQAIMHNPEVLILDEPTSGLDPNQLVEIRKLIKDLGRDKTLIFSTHIMQEVEALCDRVIIVNRGKIVADDNIENLQQRIRGELIITVEFGQATTSQKLQTIKGVTSVKSLGDNRFALSAAATDDIRQQVADFAQSNQLSILEMRKETVSVEDVFQEFTKQTNSNI